MTPKPSLAGDLTATSSFGKKTNHLPFSRHKPRWSLHRVPLVEKAPRMIYFGGVVSHTPSEDFESEEEFVNYKSTRERSPTPQVQKELLT